MGAGPLEAGILERLIYQHGTVDAAAAIAVEVAAITAGVGALVRAAVGTALLPAAIGAAVFVGAGCKALLCGSEHSLAGSGAPGFGGLQRLIGLRRGGIEVQLAMDLLGMREGTLHGRTFDDADQLAGVVRVGGVTGTLQRLGFVLVVTQGVSLEQAGAGVARLGLQKAVAILQRRGLIRVDAEAVVLPARAAALHFPDVDLLFRALPVAIGLDVEQVVRIGQ